MITRTGIAIVDSPDISGDGGKNSVRNSNMSGTTKVVMIVLSAIVGGLIGAAVASSVMTGNIGPMIDARMADVTIEAVQTAGGSGTEPPSIPQSTSLGASAPLVAGSALDSGEMAVTNVYNRLSPSVVHVNTIAYVRTWFFQVEPQEGMGSGFIFNEDGYILTNNHVIMGAQTINVRLSNGEEYEAELIGTDQMTDLAVLRITDDVEILPEWVAPLGDSDYLQVGQRAIAIGNPFGLDSTVTVGVISALNRPVSTGDVLYDSMIQTDASINPGNSGGPLINSAGHVVGINTVILSQSGGSHGIGFAIPINSAKGVIEDLIQHGRVRRPSIGFNGLNIYPALADALGLGMNYGILVQDVNPYSGAGLAGLQGGSTLVTIRDRYRQYQLYADGDIVIEFNGQKVGAYSNLAETIRRMELGEEISLTVYRDGERIEMNVVLNE